MGIDPYTPGAGRRPGVFVGRDLQFAVVLAAANQFEAGYESENIIFHGLRGVGKTVFLREVAERLRERGWLCGYSAVRHDVDAGVAVANLIGEGVKLLAPGSRLARYAQRLSVRLGGASLTVGPGGATFEVRTDGSPRDLHSDLVDVLRRLGEHAREDGTGVALLVDEMQELKRSDMAALIDAAGAVNTLPVLLIGAGLPHLPAELAAACTWAERLRYESLGMLSDQAVRRAVNEVADLFGVSFSEDALNLVITEAEGYPYFVQLFASEGWRAAGSPSDRPGTVIGLDHVASAVPAVKRQLAAGMFPARYAKATPAEREYLRAMAHLQAADPSSGVRSGDIAGALGKSLQALSPHRDGLIKKGIVFSPSKGVLEFSAPGFAAYVLWQADDQ
ncbi:MAG: AAA family ATPase [Acidimicrobiales bacterium]